MCLQGLFFSTAVSSFLHFLFKAHLLIQIYTSSWDLLCLFTRTGFGSAPYFLLLAWPKCVYIDAVYETPLFSLRCIWNNFVKNVATAGGRVTVVSLMFLACQTPAGTKQDEFAIWWKVRGCWRHCRQEISHCLALCQLLWLTIRVKQWQQQKTGIHSQWNCTNKSSNLD